MKFQIFSDNEWLYPDSVITEGKTIASLYLAKNASDCFQILTDTTLKGGEAFKFSHDLEGLEVTVLQLLPARVEANSAADYLVTLDYETVKDFVERQAPYDVFDVTATIDGDALKAGRCAFYVRVKSSSDTVAGERMGKVEIIVGNEKIVVDVSAEVYSCAVPELEDAKFGMINWLFPDHICKQHNVAKDSDEFWDMMGKYIDNELDMRNTHLQLPSGIPIRDEEGKVIGFDFTFVSKVGNLALEKGFNYIYGGFVARFEDWKDDEQYLLWDRKVGSCSIEGYRQLKLYFEAQYAEIEKHGWKDRYMQGLVDEPQFPNSMSYRALSGICRQCMPGIKIIDPVESTELYGALEIWVIKQAVYDKYPERYQAIRKEGGELWVYTCGFPAGDWMNRAIDLSPLAGRLPTWMAVADNMLGFLHWGYNAWNDKPYEETCYNQRSGERKLPPGNGFIVYPGDNGPWDSIRSHLQRAGAEEAELLLQYMAKDEAAARALIAKVCTSFKDYTKDISLFADVRKELLEALSR